MVTFLKRLRAAWDAFLAPPPPIGAAKADELPDEPGDTTLNARLRALELRALNGREAWRCCVGGKRQSQFFLFRLVDEVEEWWHAYEKMQPRQALVAVGGAVRVLEMGWSAVGPALGINVAWDVGRPQRIEWAEDLPMPRTQYECELIQKWMRVGIETIRKTEPDCIDCIEKRVFGQSTPRKNFRLAGVSGKAGRIRRRTPGGSKP